ncbi:hypothetical protein HDV06_005712 [Boothiomyces sp. JEL0866]|nr:hypothetical protein HDV06_005712 [Boothiomyces sp. JEL0866]
MILQSIWTAYDCQGVPSSLLLFNDSYPTINYYINPVPYCGFNNFPTENGEGCCVSSVDIEASGGITSWINTYLDDVWTNTSAAYSLANGNTYCELAGIQSGNYTQTQYFLNNNQCIYGSRCNDSYLTVYEENSCLTITDVFAINPYGANQYQSSLGNVSVSQYKFSDAKNYISWYAYAPGYEFVLSSGSNIERFAIACFTLSILISLCVWGYYIPRKKWLIITMSSICLARTVTFVAYTYSEFPTILALTWTTFLLDAAKVYFLLGNYITCKMMNKILNIKNDPKRFIIYGIVTVAYFGLECMTWYQDVMEMYPQLIPDLVFFEKICSIAYLTDNIYVGFIFFFDSLPVVLLFAKIVGQQKKTRVKEGLDSSLLALIKKYWRMVTIMILQVCAGTTHLLLNYISNSTTLLGSDKVVLSMSAVYLLIQNNHNLLIIFLYEYLCLFAWELVQPKSNDPTPAKQVMLLDLAAPNANKVEVTALMSGTVEIKTL